MTDKDPTTPKKPRSNTGTKKDANNVVPLSASPSGPTTSQKIMGFVKKHPVLTVAGGLVAGVAISAVLPRKTGRKLLGRAVHLAEAAGAATMMAGRETSGKARSLGYGAKRKAGKLASHAEKTGDATAARLEKYGLAALAAANALGRATAGRAAKIGDAAADTGHHIADMARRVRH